MKLKILKDCKLAQKPWEPHLCFNKDAIVDVKNEEVARTLLALKYAKCEKEEKAMPGNHENKMLDTSKMENKSVFTKGRGRPKKNNKED